MKMGKFSAKPKVCSISKVSNSTYMDTITITVNDVSVIVGEHRREKENCLLFYITATSISIKYPILIFDTIH